MLTIIAETVVYAGYWSGVQITWGAPLALKLRRFGPALGLRRLSVLGDVWRGQKLNMSVFQSLALLYRRTLPSEHTYRLVV
jgi:hypothetical protein